MKNGVVSVRTISDAICARPGITPKALSEQLEFPLRETMHTLQLLLRNKHIAWSGGVVDTITPTHSDAAIQLQTIINVTGLDVDRPLTGPMTQPPSRPR